MLGPQYTVTENGLRNPDGTVESLGTTEQFRIWRGLRASLFQRGRVEFVTREVTGRDHVFDDGLLVGASIRLKAKCDAHPGVPMHVDSATDWESGNTNSDEED